MHARWTEEEDQAARAAYEAGGIRAARAACPSRHVDAIRLRAHRQRWQTVSAYGDLSIEILRVLDDGPAMATDAALELGAIAATTSSRMFEMYRAGILTRTDVPRGKVSRYLYSHNEAFDHG